MVLINKEEASLLRRTHPDAHIVRTMKNKSKRHKYYCEETPNIMRWLNDVRARGAAAGGVPCV